MAKQCAIISLAHLAGRGSVCVSVTLLPHAQVKEEAVIGTHSLISRRWAVVWIAAAVLGGLALMAALSGAQSVKADSDVAGTEKLVVTPSEADFVPGTRSSRTTVWVYGAGFTPGASVIVLIADQRGVATDIGALSGVDVVANDDGAFGFAWTFGRFTRTGVGGEGMFSVRAVDAGTFDDLATAPLALCNLSGRGEDEAVPSHCSG